MSSPNRPFSRLASTPATAGPAEGADALTLARSERGSSPVGDSLRPRAERARVDPDAVRARIVEVAEEQFRRVGYAKTAVADIATELGMSAANVYRYFPSKLAINEAICARLLSETDRFAADILSGEGSASDRLRRFVVEIHRFNKRRLTDEHRMYDMVAVAMEQNWASVEAHIETTERLIAELIAEGVAAGEFKAVDPADTAVAVLDCCLGVFHPSLIAQCAHKDQEADARRIADFILLALQR